jgi:hypothetical protein
MAVAPRAEALSLIGPGTSTSVKDAAEPATEIRFGGGHGGGGGFHGGGGFRGGGGFGGGFRGGGAVFHGGGGFRPAFHGGGVYRGGGIGYAAPMVRHHSYAPIRHFGYRQVYRPQYYGYRHHIRPRYYGYAPVYSHGPRRFCRVIWTYYGPRKICRYKPWRHHWRHHHRRVYW